MNDDWLKQIKTKASEEKQAAPSLVWSRIEQSLELEEKRKVIPFWRYATIVAAAVIALLIVLIPDPIVTTERQIAHTTKKSEAHLRKATSIDEDRIIAKTTTQIHRQKRNKSIQIEDIKQETTSENIEENIPQEEIQTVEIRTRSDKESSDKKSYSNSTKKNPPIQTDAYNIYDSEQSRTFLSRKSNTKPSIALNLSADASNFDLKNKSSSDFALLNSPGLDRSESPVKESKPLEVFFAEKSTINSQPIEDAYEYEHNAPIKIGLSARFPLSHQLAIETGLTYSYLNSKLFGKFIPIESVQKLYYIGIPIKLQWSPFDWNKFDFYLSSGIELEKCIYGVAFNEKIKTLPYQLSLTGGVGGQYNVSKKLGIYIEPSYIHFFDDGSSIQSIRKKKPDNIELKIGIRFTY